MKPFKTLTKLSLLVSLILFVLSSVSRAAKVLDIGDKLPELLDKYSNKNWLIKFYAPWCHHCQQLELTYNNVAEKIYHKHDDLIVGRVDCTKYGKLCEDMKIDSYPTVMFLNKKTNVKYKGDRTKNSIIAFAERLRGPDIGVLASCNQLKIALKEHELLIISTLKTESNLKSAYETTAQSHKPDYWFYQILSNPKKCDNFNMEEEDLYILKKNLNRAISYQSVRSSDERNIPKDQNIQGYEQEEIIDWIRNESFPIYGRISTRNIERSLTTRKALMLAIIDEYKPARHIAPSSHEFSRSFEKLAIHHAQQTENYERFIFGWSSDLDLIEYITLSPVKIIPNVILINSNFSYYLLAQGDPPTGEEATNIVNELTEHNITRVISNFKNGKLDFSGGNSYLHVVLRQVLGKFNKFMSTYRANPLLVSLIFGFPSAILIFVLYTTCCDGSEEDQEKLVHSDDEEDGVESDEDGHRLVSNGHLKQD